MSNARSLRAHPLRGYPSAIHRLVPALIAVACATAAPGRSVSLTDVRWRLIELEGAPTLTPSSERIPNLRFARDGARVTGFTTCNSLFGGYDAPGGDRLRLTGLGSTKMACVDPALAQQEHRFMAVLGRVERFTIGADTLTLFDGTRPLARFVAEQSR